MGNQKDNKGLLQYRKENAHLFRKMDKYKKELKTNPTPAELLLKNKFKQLGLNFKFQKSFLCPTFQCIVDFFFTTGKRNMIIEVDGGYHFSSEQQRKDKYRERWIYENRNCSIIRLTNEEVMNDMENSLIKIATHYLSNNNQRNSINHRIFTKIVNDYNNGN